MRLPTVGRHVTIREATPDDAPAVRRVAEASWHAAHDHIVGAEAVDDVVREWYDTDDVRESIERPGGPMFLAVPEDDVVGFAQGSETEAGPGDAVVGRLYVHPDRWGNGHGSALLDRLFDAFRAAGHEAVWLAVLADNAVGRSFYDRQGFTIHDERTVDLAGETADEVVLVREL